MRHEYHIAAIAYGTVKHGPTTFGKMTYFVLESGAGDGHLFIDCIGWDRRFVNQLTRQKVQPGTRILLTGRLKHHAWNEGGELQGKHQIIVDSFTVLGGYDGSDARAPNPEAAVETATVRPRREDSVAKGRSSPGPRAGQPKSGGARATAGEGEGAGGEGLPAPGAPSG